MVVVMVTCVAGMGEVGVEAGSLICGVTGRGVQ
jgi:hypothetical protein